MKKMKELTQDIQQPSADILDTPLNNKEQIFISSVPIQDSKLKIYQIFSPMEKLYGMNADEIEVMNLLSEAQNKFMAIKQTHTDHKKYFVDAIAKCEDQLIHRVAQREFPKDFPTHKCTE